jgi:hypothetical protein
MDEHLENKLEKFEDEFEWDEIWNLKNFNLCIFIMLLQVFSIF